MGDRENSRGPAAGRNGDHQPTEPSDYDTLLPIQYYESVAGGHSPSGEFKLFFAILEDALRCYVRAKNCRSAARRAEFIDARAWFFAPATVRLNSVLHFQLWWRFLGFRATGARPWRPGSPRS